MTPPKMAIRPTQIWVGAMLYRVTYSHDEIRLKSADKNKSLWGSSNHASLIIIIDDEPVEQVIRDTLLHEVLHCLWSNADIGDMEMTQEEIIGCITPRLLSLLRVNPVLAAYLVYESPQED